MKFIALVPELHLTQNFCQAHKGTQTGRRTDRQTFSRNSQIVIKHPKICESIKNKKSKIFAKPILSSIYIEGSKNERLKMKKRV